MADRFEHAGEPDFLLDGFGSIWSQTASGDLLRLHPSTGELLDTYDTGWALSYDDNVVVRVAR